MNNTFRDDLYATLNGFNIKRYKYLFFDRSSFIPPVIFSTFPKEWLKIYRDNKLYHTDPIVNFGRISVKPFSWLSVMPYLISQNQDFLKLAKSHDVHNGYTFTINDPLGNTAFLNLLCDESSGIDIEFFDAHRAELQILLVDLYDLYLREKKSIEYYRNKLSLMLSEKEKQVLSLGCNGLKYREIALRLDISERTVKHHISNIVEKLNVGSAKQAFLRLKELNII